MSRFPPMFPVGGSFGPDFLDGWDFLSIGGYQFPGKPKFTKCEVKTKHDPKPAVGKDGAKPTISGIDPQPFDIEVDTWTDAQNEILGKVCDKILPQKGQPSKPFAIIGPSVRIFRAVTKVIVLGSSGLMRTDKGARLVIYTLHWLPSGKKTNTGTPLFTDPNARSIDADGSTVAPSLQSGVGEPNFSVSP